MANRHPIRSVHTRHFVLTKEEISVSVAVVVMAGQNEAILAGKKACYSEPDLVELGYTHWAGFLIIWKSNSTREGMFMGLGTMGQWALHN
jgi:hypothetical protein